jgi:hypothetical protein
MPLKILGIGRDKIVNIAEAVHVKAGERSGTS